MSFAHSSCSFVSLTFATFLEQTQDFVPAPTYNLPWNRQEPDPDLSEASSNSGNEKSPVGGCRGRLSNSSITGGANPFAEDIDDSLLLDAEALIGNAMKMGIKNQILPRAPKKISIFDIPDLQIVDSLESSSGRTPRSYIPGVGSRDSFEFGTSSDEEGSEFGGSGASNAEDASSRNASLPEMDGDSIDDAIKNFQEKYLADSEIGAMKSQYTAIFCVLQRELSESKKRIAKLSQQLEEKSEENASFRTDIETLQNALTAVQIADKVNELAVGDMKQLTKRISDPQMKAVPENFY